MVTVVILTLDMQEVKGPARQRTDGQTDRQAEYITLEGTRGTTPQPRRPVSQKMEEAFVWCRSWLRTPYWLW